MIKKFFLFLLNFYQRFLSILLPRSCRYYPTCSEYAKWRVENENIIKAFFFIILRVLRCNQLFSGGIDYPVVARKLESKKVRKLESKRVKIKYWLVPTNRKNHFYIIKNIYLKKEKDV